MWGSDDSRNGRYSAGDPAELPLELQPLAHALDRDGAGWRAHLPDEEQLARRVIDLIERPRLEPLPVTSEREAPFAPSSRRAAGTYQLGPGPGRGRSLLAVAAMVAVVVLIAALFHEFASQGTATGPRQATPTAPPGGQWQVAPGLTGNNPPTLAPSDPRVAYRSNGQSLQRTDDAGATWHVLPLPAGLGTPQDYFLGALEVSPLASHTVFLTVATTSSSSSSLLTCQGIWTGEAKGGELPQAGMPDCWLLFVSVDGGEHWQRFQLPVKGLFGGFRAAYGAVSLAAPGSDTPQIYSYVPVKNPASASGGPEYLGSRLIASQDGGLTWTTVDGTLVAHHQLVTDFAAAPGTATLYAVTQPDNIAPLPCAKGANPQFWRSDDAGQSWTQLTGVPFTCDSGMLLASHAGGQPVLYVDGASPPEASATDFQVSSDGGRTWTAAPSAGAPVAMLSRTGPLVPLADGSVLVGFIGGDKSGHTITFYGWKPGGTSWKQMTPPVDALYSPRFCAVVADAASRQTLWVEADTGNGTATDRYTLP
jgi:hypothetical protein